MTTRNPEAYEAYNALNVSDGTPLWMARPRLRLAILPIEAKLFVVDIILAVFVVMCVAYA